jgi:Family of unknown function (DUF6209)
MKPGVSFFAFGFAFAFALAACAPPGGGGAQSAEGPLIGKADGGDAADRGCQVIVRSFAREPSASGSGGAAGFTVENGYWVWIATVDVARPLADAGATASVLYRPDTAGPWWRFDGAPVDGGGAAFQRFRVRVNDRTTPTPAMEPRSWEYQRAELAAYAQLASGARLFDHNRVRGDFENYALTPSNNFAVDDAPGVCPAEPPRAVLDFAPAFTQSQHGEIVAGGRVTVRYAIERLLACRYSRAGYQLWDVEANVELQPQGTVITRAVTMVTTPPGQGPTRAAVPIDVDVPAGTEWLEVWFRNYDAERCEAWDSNYGANYHFGVDALPAPPAWAGDWGGSFARDCVHADGLAEPIIIDEYVRERACTFVDADVYVPGLTDGAAVARPELIWAQVELARDGGAPAYDWLAFQGRVNNNWRFRFTLPPDVRDPTWTRDTFSLRFSSDGIHFLTIGPRTIVRAF